MCERMKDNPGGSVFIMIVIFNVEPRAIEDAYRIFQSIQAAASQHHPTYLHAQISSITAIIASRSKAVHYSRALDECKLVIRCNALGAERNLELSRGEAQRMEWLEVNSRIEQLRFNSISLDQITEVVSDLPTCSDPCPANLKAIGCSWSARP